MKILNVYAEASFFKFYPMYTHYSCEVDGQGNLLICSINPITGEASFHACFKKWDYCIVETKE